MREARRGLEVGKKGAPLRCRPDRAVDFSLMAVHKSQMTNSGNLLPRIRSFCHKDRQDSDSVSDCKLVT